MINLIVGSLTVVELGEGPHLAEPRVSCKQAWVELVSEVLPVAF